MSEKVEKKNILETFVHYTVMKNEVVDSLNCYNSDKIFVDCTLGGGGHSEEILKRISPNGRLISFDVDDDAIQFASNRLKDYKNLTIIRGSYLDIDKHLASLGIDKITGGVIFDLGASYHQLTCQERGFSFMKDAPLDMRFNQNQDFCAYDIINKYSEKELVEIFSTYGEERFSKRIASAIVKNRPIKTTLELSNLIVNSTPKIKTKIHPATRVFQALRIEVNHEHDSLKEFLNSFEGKLNKDGRVVIITFHSLEDRMVKQKFKSLSTVAVDKRIALRPEEIKEAPYVLISRKALVAGPEELENNPRAKSAKLRGIRKVGNRIWQK